jgi:hypothetical protein
LYGDCDSRLNQEQNQIKLYLSHASSTTSIEMLTYKPLTNSAVQEDLVGVAKFSETEVRIKMSL